MNDSQQQLAAKLFAAKWFGKGYEKGQSQIFWTTLLRDVYGIDKPEEFINFEEQVKLDHTSFIDGYIPLTKVMIEQKSIGKSLDKPIQQSDGTFLTPFKQAKRYIIELPVSKHPLWVVTCNFQEFYIYDMDKPGDDPERIKLEDLEKEYYRMQFLVDPCNTHIKRETDVSIKAGDVVGLLYDALLHQYKNPTNPESLKSLNKLCVRIVFCLYAEDAGVFGRPRMFHDYLQQFDAPHMRRALIDLFKTLDTPYNERDDYLSDDLAAFPYVNGGLFADENIEIPQFTDEIRTLILVRASDGFNWKYISPTIFGAVFESTLNPEMRRSGGMHYTSIENIHKVIGPLFLDDLKAEFEQIKKVKTQSERKKQLLAFQDKLASLTFLDPAAGSGNFLTESYIQLRKLENQAVALLLETDAKYKNGQLAIGEAFIKVKINQFHGIEINDFAVTVARTALWIAESQMLNETKSIVYLEDQIFPLITSANIVEGNALRINWEDVVPKDRLNYIMGNPPFVGLSLRTPAQQEDMDIVFKSNDRAGRLDYVAAWYKKASQFIQNTNIEASFVSTNSICQGEQVPILWDDILNNHKMHINFAYRTFVWNSEANDKAHVHCVIIGFGSKERSIKQLFDGEKAKTVSKINAYLVDADNVFIALRGKPQPGMPNLVQGNKPWDGGYLILSPEEREKMISDYPSAEKLIRQYIGSFEFINRRTRYCLWLKDVPPSDYSHIPPIIKRLEGVAETRRKTKTVAVQLQAKTPMLFSQIRQPDSDYILIPETSSSSRDYVPIGFMQKDVIASNSTLVATNADLYLFGLLTSSAHMAWMRTVCGRLKSDYRYSPSVYNNFPWPAPSDDQRKKIEQTASCILEARERYPNSSLADLYDPLTMPPDLLKAHQANDRAVISAYGIPKDSDEPAIIAWLMRLYLEKTKT